MNAKLLLSKERENLTILFGIRTDRMAREYKNIALMLTNSWISF